MTQSFKVNYHQLIALRAMCAYFHHPDLYRSFDTALQEYKEETLIITLNEHDDAFIDHVLDKLRDLPI